MVHYAVCEETWTDAQGAHHSTWVSARPFPKGTIVTRCNRMARHRWDIEEHILGEKHLGYHDTHLYSQDWQGMQGFHALMRLAYLLPVLALHQTTLWPVLKKTIQGPIQWTGPRWPVLHWIANDWPPCARGPIDRASPDCLLNFNSGDETAGSTDLTNLPCLRSDRSRTRNLSETAISTN